jgi:hypothetical protein
VSKLKQEERAGEDRKEAGLMVIRLPPFFIFAGIAIERRELAPSGYASTRTHLQHALVISYGDGDPQVTVKVTRGSRRAVTFNGAEFRVVPVAEENVTIEYINTDPQSWRNCPTVEILFLRWREIPGPPL